MASSGRRAVKNGTVTVAGVLIAELFDCSIKASAEIIESKAMGELRKQRDIDGIDYTVTAKAYKTVGAATSFLTTVATAAADVSTTAPRYLVTITDGIATIFNEYMIPSEGTVPITKGKMREEEITFLTNGD